MARVWATWLRSKSILASGILSDALYRKGRERALACAQHGRRFLGEVDHRARLRSARPAVDHEVELVLEYFPDFKRIGERRGRAGKQQGRRQHRLAQLGQQG